MKNCPLLFLSTVLAVALVGCGGVLTSDQPPEHVYWLDPANLQFGEPPTGDLPDLVVTVRAIPGLDTDRILVKGPGAQLNHYAGARWPDYLPEIVTVLVRLSLESSGQFHRVASNLPMSRDEWTLDLELREFFAAITTAGTPPQAHVKLVGQVNCGSATTAVSATTTAAAREDRLSEIVVAFQSAADQAMSRLGAQLATGCFGQEALREP